MLNCAPDAEEIGDGAAETKVGADRAAVFGRGLLAALVTVREAVNDGSVVAHRRRRGAGGNEQVLLHVVGVGFAGHAFDNLVEELDVGDGPVPQGPGLVHPLTDGEQGDDFVHRPGLAGGRFERVAAIVVVDDAGGIGDQLADGDLMSLSGKLGEILRDVVVEGELAAFDLLHDSHSGERQHRADDVIDGIGSGRRLQPYVGKAVTLEQQDPVAACDQHGGPDHVCLYESLPGDRVEIRRRRLGHRQGWEAEQRELRSRLASKVCASVDYERRDRRRQRRRTTHPRQHRLHPSRPRLAAGRVGQGDRPRRNARPCARRNASVGHGGSKGDAGRSGLGPDTVSDLTQADSVNVCNGWRVQLIAAKPALRGSDSGTRAGSRNRPIARADRRPRSGLTSSQANRVSFSLALC